MDISPGAAITISLVLAIVLSACSATVVLSLPAGRTTATGIIAGVPGPADDEIHSKVLAIDDSSNGRTVHIADGDTILVRLNEFDADRTWHYSGDDGFKVVSDTVLQTYPAMHNFRVKALRPGELRFTKVDSRDGFVIDTFSVRVTIDKSTPGGGPKKTHPLEMIHTIIPDMSAFRFWH
jgi:hypothetical protein